MSHTAFVLESATLNVVTWAWRKGDIPREKEEWRKWSETCRCQRKRGPSRGRAKVGVGGRPVGSARRRRRQRVGDRGGTQKACLGPCGSSLPGFVPGRPASIASTGFSETPPCSYNKFSFFGLCVLNLTCNEKRYFWDILIYRLLKYEDKVEEYGYSMT